MVHYMGLPLLTLSLETSPLRRIDLDERPILHQLVNRVVQRGTVGEVFLLGESVWSPETSRTHGKHGSLANTLWGVRMVVPSPSMTSC